MNEEMESATPAQVETTEQVQSVENNGSEATTEQTTESSEQQNADQSDQGKKTPPAWAAKRFSELTQQRNQAAERAAQAEQRAQMLEEQLQRIQRGEEVSNDAGQVDVHTLARQEAEKLVRAQRFDEKCNQVYEMGKSDFQDFDQAISNLQMLGVTPEFLELTTEFDASHKLLHHLGSDPDEAMRILRLPPVKMARELTKLEFKLNQPPPPRPVSRAPAPITPIGTGGVTDSGLSDDLPIDEWMRRHAKRK